MTFKEVKARVCDFLRNSGNDDPSGPLNAYFTSIPKERRIRKAEELLILLESRTVRQTYKDMVNSGSPGVITLRLHYAYPLLLTVLGWWVHAVYDTEMAKELTPEEKLVLRKHLKDGISRWDWKKCDENHYDYLLDRLVSSEPKEKQKPPRGILERVKSFFFGSY